MSEHIQPAPAPHHIPSGDTLPERTPGVLHERGGFNFRLILSVGGGLIITALIIHVAVWWLLSHYEIPHAPPLEGESSLALEDARRPLNQRLLDVPPPLLEGIRIEPRGVEAARQRAEARMNRYGWADRQQDVAHIPVAVAMEEVLQSKAFRPSEKKKSDGRIAPPARSNSGRGTEGGKP
jgi:hypothetical protein